MMKPGVQKPHWDPCRSTMAALDRVEPVVLGKVLDRHQFSTVDHAEQQNAAVHRLVDQLSLDETPERDRAGAAVALAAAFLGAGLSLPKTQVVEKGFRRPDIVQFDDFAAPEEADRIAHDLAPPVCRIAEGREQQRYMIVAIRLGYSEANGNDIEKQRVGKMLSRCLQIVTCMKPELICTCPESIAVQDRAIHTRPSAFVT